MKKSQFMNPKNLFVVVGLVLTLFCGSAFATQTSISVASGTSGGAFYIVGAALAQIVQKYEPSITANSEATGGTSENLRLVANKKATIGMGMADDIVAAYEGLRGFKNKPANNLRVLMSGQSNTFHVVTLANSGITKLSDLRGKKISLGPAGAPFFGPDLLEKVVGLKKGKDYNGQYLGHDQAADALANGDIDVLICTIAYPGSALSSLSMTKDLRFIEFTEENMKRIKENFPFWKDVVIPKNTYKNTKNIRTAAVPVWLFADKDTDSETIYKFVKTVIEHSDELAKIHPDAGKYILKTATEGVTLPFHPGAEKYFKEKKIL